MKKLLILLLSVFAVVNLQGQSLDEAFKAIDGEQFEKARGILEQLVKSNPDNGEYFFHLGTLYLTLGEDALAKSTFQKGLGVKKAAHFNHIGMGQIALNEGRKDDAAAEFAKATAVRKKKDTQELLFIARAYLNAFNPDYAKAAEYAKQVIAINSSLAQGYLTLGDAELNLKNLNDAFMAYRNASSLDNTLLQALLRQAMITKSTYAFPEAIQVINDVIANNASFGPAYRELAEIYYMWAILDSSVYDENIKKALDYYKQYISLTDTSLNSRMRHADFLVLAKDYASLEKEAAEMQKIDNVNPRILRYLGYSAFENGKYQDAIEALQKFIEVVEPYRVLLMDHIYIGRAKVRLLMANEDVATIDPAKLAEVNDMIRLIVSDRKSTRLNSSH